MLFPVNDSDLVVWLNQFAKALDKYSARLGFTPVEIIAIKSDAAMLHYLVAIDVPAYESALSARKAYKQLVKYGPPGESGESVPVPPSVVAPPAAVEPGIVPRLYQLILRMQSSPNYTEEMDVEFGMVG